MYYTIIIRLLIETMLDLCINGLIEIVSYNFSNAGYILSFMTSVLSVTAVIAFGLWLNFFLYRKLGGQLKN